MNNPRILEIKDLEVVYQTDMEIVHAVNKLDLVLNQKETLGLVGETGAGKTTTALSIMRLLPSITGKIVGGEIYFNGENILEMPEEKMRWIRGERISMIFQDPMSSLNPVETVGSQITEALELHNADRKSRVQIQNRVDEILEMVGIPAGRKKEYPHQFSGGMKQRVVIAIALACSPDLLIADEPTTALDVTIQAQVLDMMAELKEKLGTAMIMITHDLGIVADICDKVAVMYAGEIIEAGTVEDIFQGIRHHPYTTGLFNSLPNLQVTMRRLNPIDGLMPDPTHLPAGCKFHPRCKECFDLCTTVVPPVYTFHESHQVRCHLYAKEVEDGASVA